MAAGISLKQENIAAFRKRLNEFAKTILTDVDLTPTLRLDSTISLDKLSLSDIDSLQALQPTGQGLPPVQVAVTNLELCQQIRWMGSEKQHAKLIVTDGAGSAEVVWWNAAGEKRPSGRFDLAVQPAINSWKGRRSVQLKMLDWRPST